MNETVGDTSQLQETCASLSGEGLHETLHKLQTQLGELQDSISVKGRDAARSTDLLLHQHLYGAIGFAAAAGVLVGLLAARR